ncbi:hypothetical protein MZTS_24485, partial [Methylorubrum zatmanii]|nr:hypothetical protein [Methylorubrum zatmanii]
MSLTDEADEPDRGLMALDAEPQPAVAGKKRGICAISGIEMGRRNLVSVASLRAALAA